jgi:predicted HTH domain antitoxin
MAVELPDSYISLPAYTEQDLKTDIAVMLYQRKVLTLARAASWVGMSRLQFQKALALHNVPIHFSIADFDIDMKSIGSMPI